MLPYAEGLDIMRTKLLTLGKSQLIRRTIVFFSVGSVEHISVCAYLNEGSLQNAHNTSYLSEVSI